MKKNNDFNVDGESFYKALSKLFWPLLFTFILTNSFQLIDTVMLSIYDNNMSIGVQNAGQLQMIVGPVLFGITAGTGIFASQYFGAKDYDKLKKVFGLSVILSVIFSILLFVFLGLFAENYVRIFVKTDSIVESAVTYMGYLKWIYLVLPINMVFTFGFRVIKKPKQGLWTNISKGLINTGFNYLFIFVLHWGVEGAALATLISQVVVLFVNFILLFAMKPAFIGTIREMFVMDMAFVKPILIKSIPIVLSEALFGMARFGYNLAYARIDEFAYSSDVYSTNISFLINSFVMATANVSAIMIGASLGKGVLEETKEMARRLLRFMTLISVVVLLLCIIVVPVFVQFLSIEDPRLHQSIIYLTQLNGVFLGLRVFSSSILYILRAGGDNVFALVVDSGMAWMIGIPLSLLVVSLFNVNAVQLKIVTLSESVAKSAIAFYRFKSNKWMKRIIN